MPEVIAEGISTRTPITHMSSLASTKLNADRLLKLMTFLSPAFPIGTFSYSHGLEWLIDSGMIRDADALRFWISDLLEVGSGWNDAVLFAELYRSAAEGDYPGLLEVAALGEALAASSERHLETMQQGRAFLTAVCAAWACEPAAVLERIRGAALPVAVAAVTADHGIALSQRVAGLSQCLRGQSRLGRRPPRSPRPDTRP